MLSPFSFAWLDPIGSPCQCALQQQCLEPHLSFQEQVESREGRLVLGCPFYKMIHIYAVHSVCGPCWKQNQDFYKFVMMKTTTSLDI